MFRTARLQIGLAAILLAAVGAPVFGADIAQMQVERLEQLSAAMDELARTASAHAGVLEEVKDSASAAASVGRLEATSKNFIAAVSKVGPLMDAVKKMRMQGPYSPEYQARLAAIDQRQPAQTQEWIKQSLRYAKEMKRVDTLQGLPSSFWDVLNVQGCRLLLSLDDILRATGQPRPPQVTRYMTDKVALYDRHGAAKVVDVSLEGASVADRTTAEKALRAALGPKVLVLSLASDQAQIITVAPVDNFNDVVATIKTEKPTNADEARRRLTIQVGPTVGGFASPVAGNAPPRDIGDIKARIAQLRAERGSAAPAEPAADAKPITDPGPDWPELEQPDDPSLYQQSGFTWQSKLEVLQNLGRDRVAFVEVTNGGELGLQMNTKHRVRKLLMAAAAPKAEFARGSGQHYMLGPVEDFDAFCKAISWGTIVERDDARRILKITADAQKFEKSLGIVRIEVVNYEEVRQLVNQLVKQEFEERRNAPPSRGTRRGVLGGPNDPTANINMLVGLAAKPDGRFQEQVNGKLQVAGVTNFDEFCKKLDFAVIVDRDNTASSLKIKVDVSQLSKEAVLKRVGDGSQLDQHDRERMGFEKPWYEREEDDRKPRDKQLAESRAEAEKTQANLRNVREIMERMKAAADAGGQPSEADLKALQQLVGPTSGAASPTPSPPVVSADAPAAADTPSPATTAATDAKAADAQPTAGKDAKDAEKTSTESKRPKTAEAAAAAANSSQEREYARLAQLLNSTDKHGKDEAIEAFLRVRPGDVSNTDTRKLIARGFKDIALNGDFWDKDKAIRGLVIWGGKYSVPILIELLDKDSSGRSEELYEAFAKLKDPQGAEAVVRHLGDSFTHERVVHTLRKMGSASEDALIKAAPSNDEKVSLAAVQLLGEVGSEKSMSVLQQAAGARNVNVKNAAKEAIQRIRVRKASGESVDKPATVDPNSPFAEGSGPAVDITARNTREFAEKSRGRGPKAAGAAGAADEGGATEEDADLDEGDWSKVSALLPGDPEGPGVPANPAPENPAAAWKPQPVRLSDKTNFFESPASLSISDGAKPIAAVLYETSQRGSAARLETADLRLRKSLGSLTIVGGAKKCYISPLGTRVLVVGDEGDFSNRKSRLEVWSLSGKAVEEVAWWPFASSKNIGYFGANKIEWADWIDENQVLVANGQGTTVLWRIEGKKAHAVWQIDADGHSMPKLSPGRAHMALATKRGVEIFRAMDGALLARMQNVRPNAGRVAFNADGTKLACVSGKSIYVWNATDGKLERDFDCTNLNAFEGEVYWLDDKHLLIGNSDVVDVPRRLLLWRLESTRLPSDFVGSLRWQFMQTQRAQGLVPSQLLQPEVLAPAEGLDPEAILAIKPGAKVSLDIQVGGEEQQKAESAIRAALDRAGLVVDPNAPIKVSARLVTGQSESQEYGSGFFNRENREQVTAISKHFEVEITMDGQSLWKQTTTIQAGGLPSVIWTKEGESAQQAYDRENSSRTANFSFSAAFPRYVVQPKYAGPLGAAGNAPGGPGD